MERTEKWKTLFCFGLLGCVVMLLFARLLYLQGGRAEPNRLSARRARDLNEKLPAPRGDIVDRFGNLLAYDRPTLTIRAEFQARVAKGTRRIPADLIEFLAGRLASHLHADDARTGTRRDTARRLAARIREAKHRVMPSKLKTVDYLQAEFLVDRDLDSYEVVRRLRREAKLWRAKKEMPGRLHLNEVSSFKRTYPDRDFTRGPIGNHYIAHGKIAGKGQPVRHEVAEGLEACCGLWPERPELRRGYHLLDFKDARRRRFWTGIVNAPKPPARMYSTLDLELQRLAHKELRDAAAEVQKVPHYKSSYEWGAMVLVEIESGEILAIASHYPGRQGPAPFAPIENAFEPGSVVKPLVIGLALERGVVRWDDTFDCSPTEARHGKPVAGFPKRIIRDDHACGVLDPHGIIVNSSNIGAVMIGTRLGPVGMKAYVTRYGFGRRTDLGLPKEAVGSGPNGGIAKLESMSPRQFGTYTGPSLSFGYELNVTAVQLARAYLRLLSGRERELRLVRGLARDGRVFQAEDRPQPTFLSVDTITKIKAAMAGVVAPEAPGLLATGRHLYQMIQDLGHSQPLIGGKTGTTDSRIAGIQKKTATFIGFAPARAPRYLVVCVLRKDRAARFYGGSYAAPAAGRLLLGALALEKKGRESSIRQVRAWSEDRGLPAGTMSASGISSSKRKTGGS